MLKSSEFIVFVNKVWTGNYDIIFTNLQCRIYYKYYSEAKDE